MPIPFLPAAIAAFTALNGAHYWHQQLKPFESSMEQHQAIKETLAESPFVAQWAEDHRRALVSNPHFLTLYANFDGNDYGEVEKLPEWNKDTREEYFRDLLSGSSLKSFKQWTYYPSRDDVNIKCGLSLGSLKMICALNRFHLKNTIAENAASLGHEGTHHVQMLLKGKFKGATRIDEDDADLQGFDAVLNDDTLSSKQKIYNFRSEKVGYDKTCREKHTSSARIPEFQRFNEEQNDERWIQLIEQAKKYDRICEIPDIDVHSPCKIRGALAEKYLKLALIEQINDTIRDEIAWQ